MSFNSVKLFKFIALILLICTTTSEIFAQDAANPTNSPAATPAPTAPVATPPSSPPAVQTPPAPNNSGTGQAPVTEPQFNRSSGNKSEVTINLPPQVDLTQFMKIISTETNTMFVYKDQIMKGQMFITSPPNFKVTVKDAFFIFEKLLDAQGLSLVRRGDSNIVEIIQSKDAKFSRMPIETDEVESAGPDSETVIRLVSIKHTDLQRVKSLVTPLFSKNGTILSHDTLDLLILMDSRSNIDRIVEVIEAVDTEEPPHLRREMTLYRMRYTQLGEVFKTVTTVFGNLTRNGKKENVTFLIEKRLNSLVILANTEFAKEIIEFIKKIDVPEEKGAKLTIIELQFASAKMLAPLLSQIFGIPDSSGGVQVAPQPQQPGGAESTSVPVKILTTENLNALVVIADPETTKEISTLVKQMDVERGDVQLVLHPLKFASARVVAPLLSGIFSDQVAQGKAPGSTPANSRVKIIAEPRLNALIIIADNYSLRGIFNLLKDLDVAEGDNTYTIHRLRYASSKRLATLLQQVFQRPANKEGAIEQEVTIIPDTRMNALIILASPGQRDRILDLIAKLDVSIGDDERNYKIYKLQYASAAEMGKMLKEVTGSILRSGQANPAAQPNAPGQPAQPAGQPAQPAAAKEKQVEERNPNAEIQISTDEGTNSILVFGPSDIFTTMDRIIAELDVRRVQVYIEALIMEVTLSKSLNFGIDWRAAGPNAKGDALVGAGFPSGVPFTTESAAAAAAQHNIGYVGGGTLKFNNQTFLSFGAFIQASQTDSQINILANPQLLMLDNQESSINVSTEVPVATNAVVDANGRVSDQVIFKDVGVILNIKPQISGNDNIRLNIHQTSSDISPTSVGNSKAVSTLKRELKTSVVTADDSIVVLGGLINERLNKTDSKLPGFGDLPLLGWLFKTDSEGFNKTNLLMFIRPKIIRNQQELIEVTDRVRTRYQEANKKRNITTAISKEYFHSKETKSNSAEEKSDKK